MNPPSLLLSEIAVQWTLLMALGWTAHALLRNGHPRWRVTLWRGVLCLGFALLTLGLLRLPRPVQVPLPYFAAKAQISFAPQATATLPDSRARSQPPAPASSAPAEISSTTPSRADTNRGGNNPLGGEAPGSRVAVSWTSLLFVLWAAGSGWEGIRLLRLHLQLRAIVRRAPAASPSTQAFAWQIQTELKMRRPVRVRISDTVASPLLCGVWEPLILIPRPIAESLTAPQLAALLSHELAHARRHDLAWCIAWRLVRAAIWFHPLVWRIPDAHGLACEEEADRLAAQRVYDGEGYPRLLAQLAWLVVRPPTSESHLALNATSHLARRLLRLGQGCRATWNARHSWTAGAVVASWFVLTAGWQFAQPTGAEVPAFVETGSVRVTVQDETGAPVQGATITPTSLRAKEARLRTTGYGWVPARHGPVVKAVSGPDGNARVTYPLLIVPAEKIFTGEISFAVEHPDFANARTTGYSVDGTGPPVQLTRGIPLRVAAHFGANQQRVADIRPYLLGDPNGVQPEDWQREADGTWVWRRMTRGKHFLFVMGKLPSGELVYSDPLAFFGEQRDSHDLSLALKPGVRVEGKIDAKVPRPIKGGWVQLSVHDDEANTTENRAFLPRSIGNTGFWWSYRPLNADGSFAFESVPEGELKLIAYGEGFISSNGPPEEPPVPLGYTPPPQPPRRVTRSIPQSFPAVRPITALEVGTQATASLQVTATANGRPVPGAKIHVWPNVVHMPTGTRVFGAGGVSHEAHFRTLPPLPALAYSESTDKNGVAMLRNLPEFTGEFLIDHPELEAPMREPARSTRFPERFDGAPSRSVKIALSAGETTQVDVALQPRGREFLGPNP